MKTSKFLYDESKNRVEIWSESVKGSDYFWKKVNGVSEMVTKAKYYNLLSKSADITIHANEKDYVNMSSVNGRGQVVQNPKYIGGWEVMWTRNGEGGDGRKVSSKTEGKYLLIDSLS